jgi:hypothetical protein
MRHQTHIDTETVHKIYEQTKLTEYATVCTSLPCIARHLQRCQMQKYDGHPPPLAPRHTCVVRRSQLLSVPPYQARRLPHPPPFHPCTTSPQPLSQTPTSALNAAYCHWHKLPFTGRQPLLRRHGIFKSCVAVLCCAASRSHGLLTRHAALRPPPSFTSLHYVSTTPPLDTHKPLMH